MEILSQSYAYELIYIIYNRASDFPLGLPELLSIGGKGEGCVGGGIFFHLFCSFLNSTSI